MKPPSQPVGLFLVVCAVAGIIAILGLAQSWLGPADILAEVTRRQAEIRGFVFNHPVSALALYTIGYAALVAVSLPVGLPLSMAGGLVFGPWVGTICAVAASTAGATVLFLTARPAFGRVLATGTVGVALQRFRPRLQRDAFGTLLAMRIFPVVPFWATNLLSAAVNIRLTSYVAATALGMIPPTIAFTLAGAGVGDALAVDAGTPVLLRPEVLLPLAGCALLVLLPTGWRWGQRAMAGRTTMAEQPAPSGGATPSRPGPGWLIAGWLIVGLLLLLCLLHGISVQRGVPVPPDIDSWRDLGFIQALLDGNYWGDPSYAGEWRYYPPLVHAIVAAAAYVSATDDLALFWTRSGIWLNLLTPVAFFLMCRGLFAVTGAAVAATCFYVLWSGSTGTPWLMGGYTAWPLTPPVAQAPFFLAVLAIVRARPPSIQSAALLHAALIGLLIGLTALAHLVPAIILTVVVTVVAAFRAQGHPRAVAWLAVVAVAEIATAAPYLVTSVLYYPDGILNEVNGGYVDDMLRLDGLKRTILINTPGAVALVAAVALVRHRRDVAPAAAAAVLAWVGVCVVLIMRHYACALPEIGQTRACSVFVLTVHHYHLYLQNAWACLMGYVAWTAIQMAMEPHRARLWRPAATVVVLAALSLGVWSFLRHGYDKLAQQAGQEDGQGFDVQAYRWVLANTAPRDVFVTELPGDWHAPAAFSVMAAGRQVIAVPVLFSNPFVPWTERDVRRQAYLDAAAQDTGGDSRLCDLRGQPAYLLVPLDFPARSPRLQPVYATAYHAAYRISTEGCQL